MYSTVGERPDGRPYSELPFPFPIPECPSNKLLVFDDFSEQEKVRLATLISSPAYKRLVEEETPYYRAFWLATQLGRPAPQALDFLLEATWEVTPGSMGPRETPQTKAKLARYQRELVDRVESLPPDVSAKDRLWLEARTANALREMRRFGEAERMRLRALADLQKAAEPGGWGVYLEKLAVVIARKDASVEPLDMIPNVQAGILCRDPKRSQDSFAETYCAKPDMNR